MFEQIITGFLIAFSPLTIGMLILGVALGGMFGALPGLTATMAMAILVPFTFFLPTMIGIPFLLGIYKGGIWGGVDSCDSHQRTRDRSLGCDPL